MDDIKNMKQEIEELKKINKALEEDLWDLEDENSRLDLENDGLRDEIHDLELKINDNTLIIQLKDKPTINDETTLEYVQRNWEEIKAIVR